tara:strand:+ start:2585 stop:3298 length:714 start_codon:yes stop_codon:yes gene_type:complete
MKKSIALIGGVGTQSGFSLALINKLLEHEYYVVGVARSGLGKEALTESFSDNPYVEFIWGDLQDTHFLKSLVSRFEANAMSITIYIHNAARLVLKPFLDTTVDDFEDSWEVTVKTAVTVSKALIPSMLASQRGVLIFTGATASIKGNANASPFAAAKFGLRALSQSLAREFGPQGIHVAHVIADGVIAGNRAQETFNLSEASCIQPDALADLYLDVICQDKSCWSQEIDARPYLEKF